MAIIVFLSTPSGEPPTLERESIGSREKLLFVFWMCAPIDELIACSTALLLIVQTNGIIMGLLLLAKADKFRT